MEELRPKKPEARSLVVTIKVYECPYCHLRCRNASSLGSHLDVHFDVRKPVDESL
jgi:hypothetical protein